METKTTQENSEACAGLAAATGSAYPWEDAYNALCGAIEEDAANIEKLVVDEDSSCPARELRRERAATLRYVLGLADNLRRWDW